MFSQDSLRFVRSGSFELLVQNLPVELVMPVKPVTPRTRILALTTSHHNFIHMLGLSIGLGGMPTLQSPLSGENGTR